MSMAKIEAKSEVMGVVAQVEGKVGDRLDAGGTIMFIESMKMQIPVLVEDAGTLQQILVKEGDAVSEGQVVALLES
jgi:acetyl-CoA carboxylase biotin carboxyl carrier protein